MLTATHTSAPTPNAIADPWHTLQSGADYARCNEASLRRMIAAGLLRHARVGLGRKSIRLRQSWIDAAMEAAATPVEVKR